MCTAVKAKSGIPPPPYHVFEEIFRVSRHQIIWGGNWFPLPPCRCVHIWEKSDISEKLDYTRYEFAWCSYNLKPVMYRSAKVQSTKKVQRFHPTQKPVKLIASQLMDFADPGWVVCDPFSGSGTVAVACKLLGLPFLAIEKDDDYCRKSCERLENAKEKELDLVPTVRPKRKV